MNTLELDYVRYGNKRKRNGGMPMFQVYLRKTQMSHNKLLKLMYKGMFAYYRRKNMCELSDGLIIGPGLYIGHPFGITINPDTVIGKNVNIHKGVTLGRENRGLRKGAPIIGSNVWIGVNSTIVGKIHIGNDVLIAPNSFVNFNVPDHSVVIGNPGRIIHKLGATVGYISNMINCE